MRAIILCILISIISHWAWGQDSVLVENRQADTLTAIRDGFLTKEEMDMYYWIFNHGGRGFISAWTIYSDECWADSTRHDNFLPQPHGYALPLWKDWVTGMVDSNYVLYAHGGSGVTLELICEKLPRFYYTHREPTLPGFIEFLERKVR